MALGSASKDADVGVDRSLFIVVGKPMISGGRRGVSIYLLPFVTQLYTVHNMESKESQAYGKNLDLG